MLPKSPCQNSLGERKRHPENFGNLSNSNSFLAEFKNLLYIGFRKFGALPAITDHVPFFINHVRCIFFRCTEEKVIGIYTTGVVAFVTDKLSFRDRALMKNPRIPMGCIELIKNTRVPISVMADGSGPKPARIGFLYMAKENSVSVPSALNALPSLHCYWLCACSALSIADNLFSAWSVVEREFCWDQ